MSFTNSTRNLTVIARNAADGFYYAGFITKGITNEEEFHHVTFYNIRPQDVLPNDVINIGGAVPWPTLKIGDYVLVAVRCRTSGLQCYMPGRVVCLPIDLRRENRFYTLKLYSGRTTTKPRRYIIKIGQDKFNEITDYISNIRYKQPKMFVSEPDLRGRLLARRHNEDTNNRSIAFLFNIIVKRTLLICSYFGSAIVILVPYIFPQ
ncbi:von Willebrand factor A domain-containing protein 3B-like [Ruditapes philippinarum]|uniref:von Willebrand factor A domain-containing protein 3B-like n=1 Tax=Ruditapes philippinarum TaxID=129788 RepID=UPI00295A666B|nr:von Willebrand factor A domain-containing protein 3B-like [Ruditapes philippinarum]